MSRRRANYIRLSRVLHERICGQPDQTLGCDDTAAPVAKAVAIGGEWDRRVGDQVVRNDDVGNARVVDAQGQDHRGRLRAVVNQFVAYADLHGRAPLLTAKAAVLVAGLEIPAQRLARALRSDSTITLRMAVQCRPALTTCFWLTSSSMPT